MKKDKTRHFETFLAICYPQYLPPPGKLGKHSENGAQPYSPIWAVNNDPKVKNVNVE